MKSSNLPNPSEATDHDKPVFQYARQMATAIVLETPDTENPFAARDRYVHGYDIQALSQQRSYLENLVLMLSGRWMTAKQSRVLNQVGSVLLCVSPRDPAARAAMVAGVSKTNASHILPIGLMALGGEKDGFEEVVLAMRYLCQQCQQTPTFKTLTHQPTAQNGRYQPGFGRCYGSPDYILTTLAQSLSQTLCLTDETTQPHTDWHYLRYALSVSQALVGYQMSVLASGLVAALALDLQFTERQGAALFQLLRAPGLVALGLEQTHKPITDYPFLEDEHYHFSND